MNLVHLARLTELDRRIIVALQRDGRASWRAIAETVDGAVATVARRGQQLLADGVVRIAGVPALGAQGPYDAFMIRINCAPGTQLSVAEQLIAQEDVRFCTLVTGQYDIMAELIVRGGATNYPQILEELQQIEGVVRWRGDLILHVYKISFDWGRQLYGDVPPPPPNVGEPMEPAPCQPEHFDEHDWQILGILKEDGRETFQAIANRLGINESSVRRRYERLRAAHCMQLLTLVPSAALGMGAETLMTVRVAPARLDAVARKLAQLPFVRYLAAMLDENALFCEVITPSTQELSRFITEELARLDGVKGWSASMELLYLKRGFVETPWWRQQVTAARR